VRFGDLTSEQQCVFDNASDEGNLRGLLNLWPCDPSDRGAVEVRSRLAMAVVELVNQGLVEVYVYGDGPWIDTPPIGEVGRLVRCAGVVIAADVAQGVHPAPTVRYVVRNGAARPLVVPGRSVATLVVGGGQRQRWSAF
jgi:hypothetical protein